METFLHYFITIASHNKLHVTALFPSMQSTANASLNCMMFDNVTVVTLGTVRIVCHPSLPLN